MIVHGMGHPKPAALMDAIVDSLAQHLRALGERQGETSPPVIEPLIGDATRDGRRVRYAGQEWAFTQAHWAPHIESPPFLDTIAWALSHFFKHASLLARQAVMVSLLPALFCLLSVMVSVVTALALLPFALVLLPIATPLARATRRWVAALYRVAMSRVPADAPMSSFQHAIVRWRKCAPLIISWSVAWPVTALAGLLLSGMCSNAVTLVACVCLAIGLQTIFKRFVGALTIDPLVDGVPLSFALAAGATPSKQDFVEAAVDPGHAAGVMKRAMPGVFRTLFVSPAFAARLWLSANVETDLHNYIRWTVAGDRLWPMVRASMLVAALVILRCLAALAWFLLYSFGALCMLPLIAVLLLVSLLPGQQQSDALPARIKRFVQSLVLKSIGDINMFTRHPGQAALARQEVEHALDALTPTCDDIVVIAHSLGCAVAYDTLVQPKNVDRVARVRSLVTIGGILPMVWRTWPRRASFDHPLPDGIRWLNLRARFDPAEGGPYGEQRLATAMPNRVAPEDRAPRGSLLWLRHRQAPARNTFDDIVVSNEDDVLFDHTSYWSNLDEVIPRIAREIWPEGGEPLDATERSDAIRSFRRRVHVVRRLAVRLAAFYSFPLLLWLAPISPMWAVGASGALCMAAWIVTRPTRPAGEAVAPPDDSHLPTLPSGQATLANGVSVQVIAYGASRLDQPPSI